MHYVSLFYGVNGWLMWNACIIWGEGETRKRIKGGEKNKNIYK
jgi:hypothetical protein